METLDKQKTTSLVNQTKTLITGHQLAKITGWSSYERRRARENGHVKVDRSGKQVRYILESIPHTLLNIKPY